MRRFFQTTAGKIIIALAELAVLVALVSGVILLLEGVGLAEDVQYVICMDRVNVRMGASSRSDEIGWLEPGDIVYLDGRKKRWFCPLRDSEHRGR